VNTARHITLFVVCTLALASCGSDDASTPAPDPGADAVASTDTAAIPDTSDTTEPVPGVPAELACPGVVAFGAPATVWATDWETTSAPEFAALYTRDKSEAHHVLGVPAGAFAATDLGDSTELEALPESLRGRRAGTQTDQGFSSTGLPGEYVSLWRQVEGTWTSLGRTLTDDNGQYVVTVAADSTAAAPAGHSTAVAVVEATGDCATHHTWLYPAGTGVVLTDIDETLTLSDSEQFMEVEDPTYVPKSRPGAVALTQAWADKGYLVIYITARPAIMRPETAAWLEGQSYASGPLITATGIVLGSATQTYKAAWVKRLIEDFGWNVAAAYGNADTDFGAFAEGGVAPEATFSIGELAGYQGTTAIENDDYTDHIAGFLAEQPEAP
jgi:hypothetical protein